MTTNQPKIHVQKVCKSYNNSPVISSVSLTVPCAEIFGLLGPSGAGKTTLVRMIAGIEKADSGSIDIFGERMPRLSMLKKIGYMAQADALYAELTAKENLEFFATLYGLKGAQRRRRMEEVMELMNLSPHTNKQIHQYSGGMKRRLSLAVAMLHSPPILILDEPTVGIDPLLRQTIWKELERLSDQGTTIIITTHVMDEANKCHRLGMIREGKLIAVGTPQTLIEETGSASIEEAFIHFGGIKL